MVATNCFTTSTRNIDNNIVYGCKSGKSIIGRTRLWWYVFLFSKALFSHTLSHNTQREKKIFLASSFPKHRQKQSKEKPLQ